MTILADGANALWNAPPMVFWPDLHGKLRQHTAPLSPERLFDQCSRPRLDQIRPPIGRKSVWSGSGGAGLPRGVAYPVLCRELRRVTIAKIYPPRAIASFQLFFDDRLRLHMAAQQARFRRDKTRAMACDFPSAHVARPHNPALKVFAVDCALPAEHTRLSSSPLQDSA